MYKKIPQPTEKQLERFSKKYIVLQNECWQWIGGKGVDGYGLVHLNNVIYRAHRVAYTIHKGPIPDGLQLDHLCRNILCVNPNHLEAVTQEENMRRSPFYGANSKMIKARREATHCQRGHEFTEDNIYWNKNPECRSGFARQCIACQRLRYRKTKQDSMI